MEPQAPPGLRALRAIGVWAKARESMLLTLVGAFLLLPIGLLAGGHFFAALVTGRLDFDWGGFLGAAVTVAAAFLVARMELATARTSAERERAGRVLQALHRVQGQLEDKAIRFTNSYRHLANLAPFLKPGALLDERGRVVARVAVRTFSSAMTNSISQDDIALLRSEKPELGNLVWAACWMVETARDQLTLLDSDEDLARMIAGRSCRKMVDKMRTAALAVDAELKINPAIDDLVQFTLPDEASQSPFHP